ncbi:MAG: DUF1998 domain-containing protein [Polyangia bacterium]|jgi:hypothetical protein|nr:DUF1998 domain-containing protein [Polyangia bacterium]
MAKGKGWGRKQAFVRPEGKIRRSQVVTTFGPGAMVDLIGDAVLVGGLDFWDYDPGKGVNVLQEPRLRDRIVGRGLRLGLENAFREPPMGDDSQPSKAIGVRALEFPQWFVCQNQDCRALVRWNNLELKGGRYIHHCGGKQTSECVPVRFVAACKKGHIEDFPWISFAHGYGKSCAAPNLRLLEGSTGDFSEIRVTCSCGKSERMSAALASAVNPACGGHRPWLGPEAREDCDQRLRLLVRTASNAYFSQVVSALSIPEKGRELEKAVRSVWDVLQAATPEILAAFRGIPKVKAALSGYSDDQVLGAVAAIKSGAPVDQGPLRTAEYIQLINQPPVSPGDIAEPDDLFFARTFEPGEGLPHKVGRVVLCSKLREVRVQVGFTRLEPVTPDLQGEFDLKVESASLGLTADWLPATEVIGEGVFVSLDEAAVAEWEEREEVKRRARELLAGYDASFPPRVEPPPFPGVRFYLLHSLSHLLIAAISLECGYAASAIRERIYCAPAGDATPMAAILLHTGSSGSEGTLGGLVEQGRRLHHHLREALKLGELCSNDPVCAGHSPKGDPAERFLEGAACHGCLFIAECSCERFNRYLDRALVVPTIGHPRKLAFFEEPA